MENFLQLLKKTQDELGRELSGEEIAFLQWVFENYSTEKAAQERKEQDDTARSTL
ncbi:hypothetical protein P5G51_003020 [Virgibacillus sp. 179-BFC.A HS]|uniref:Uncharacterized protein n=1 Tax=Tigheibacillus jepli TaxID=3035914 RepID=A0ABU5CDW9_9BACI|nr:hypothetical protein [Virgibacillus sp. 179-BFC.A HS]MDY0404514.1 hypothetical protein [Virgibacillus sp. 179-BFC.A HS]